MTPPERGTSASAIKSVHTCGPTRSPKREEFRSLDWLPTAEEIARTLPKMLRGSVHVQWVTCGKPGCKCTRGKLHGPYFYRFRREGGRLRKAYVARADLPDVLAAIGAYRAERSLIRAAWGFLRKARELLRGAETAISEGSDPA